MAKFLFCLPRFHTNAVPWVRVLLSGSHEVAVFASHAGPTESHALVEPKLLGNSCLESLRIRRNVAEIDRIPSVRELWKALSIEAPDVVIVRGITRWLSRVAAVCTIFQGRRLVIYDQEDPSPKSVGTRIRRAVFSLFGVPHVTSLIGHDELPVDLGSACSLPFGCPIAPEQILDIGVAAWPPRILMVAKYRERKGHLNLLRALARLVETHQFFIEFCGEEITEADSAYCQSLLESASSLGLAGRFGIKNNIPYDQMHSMYRGHELFVLPSRNEPAAVSPIEAAWFGCGILISKDSGTRGYVPPGIEYEFDAGDPADIARAVANAIASPEKLRAHRLMCRQHVEAVADDETILRRFNELLIL